MAMNDELRQARVKYGPTSDLYASSIDHGKRTSPQDGIPRADEGA